MSLQQRQTAVYDARERLRGCLDTFIKAKGHRMGKGPKPYRVSHLSDASIQAAIDAVRQAIRDVSPEEWTAALAMRFTRKELQKKTKGELYEIYKRYFNDEMSLIMWRGFTKADVLEIMLDGKDEVDSPWNGKLVVEKQS